MAMNVTSFVGTDNFNMETFNNMISQINSGVNSEIQTVASQLSVQIDSKPKIQTGSYVGTGKSGSSNKNSLTFDFEPKFVYIMSSSETSSSYNRLLLIRGCTKAISGESSSTENTITWSGNTVSWYTGTTQTEHIAGQLNKSGTTYRYFAIG